jgi:hypothetical protein
VGPDVDVHQQIGLLDHHVHVYHVDGVHVVHDVHVV